MSEYVNVPLSGTEQSILTYIAGFIKQHGYSPTHIDIMNGAGISSTSVVNYNLVSLEYMGYISRTPKISRGIVPNWERIGQVLGEAVA